MLQLLAVVLTVKVSKEVKRSEAEGQHGNILSLENISSLGNIASSDKEPAENLPVLTRVLCVAPV